MRVVCAVIFEDWKALVCRRPMDKDEAGKWEFPGGKVERGEGDEEALVREISEELGVQIFVSARLGESGREGMELIAYRCERISGRWQLREHLEARWIGKEEGGDLDWAALDMPLWRMLRENDHWGF